MRKFKIYLTILLVMSVLLFLLSFVSGYFSERVFVYVRNKTALYSTTVIEQAIRNEVVNNIDLDSLVIMNKNELDVVKSVNINTSQINHILAGVNSSVVESMSKLQEERLPLPLGIILSDTLFGDLGPDLYIRIVPMGSAVTDVVAKASPYGINSSLFEVSITVRINIETTIPMRKDVTTLDFNIPLVLQIINSDVPMFYFNSKGGMPLFE